MAWRMDNTELTRVIRIGREKISDKGIPSADKRVHPLSHQMKCSREEVVQALMRSFRQRFRCGVGMLTDQERIAAAELVERRYSARAWTMELP